ncbi:MAG: hypothetical protein BWX48_01058 [Verrucomicrobia bacterium ADurb.Bin006]|nr:MAG: hypothetical protein BWX48_01058 [Verrucomicrobia bacterium ADurb.Bin006]
MCSAELSVKHEAAPHTGKLRPWACIWVLTAQGAARSARAAALAPRVRANTNIGQAPLGTP